MKYARVTGQLIESPKRLASHVPELKEPETVTALRQQMRRGSSESVLHRIAGGAAEFYRLVALYGLATDEPTAAVAAPIAAPAAVVRRPAPKSRGGRISAGLLARHVALLELIEKTARAGEVFPSSHAIAQDFDCSWLVIDRDLNLMDRKGMIRVGTYRCNGLPFRRVELVGAGIFTALPPPSAAASLQVAPRA